MTKENIVRTSPCALVQAQYFGSFERHMRGVVFKLQKKMGFYG
jgi:hypothetical protein